VIHTPQTTEGENNTRMSVVLIHHLFLSLPLSPSSPSGGGHEGQCGALSSLHALQADASQQARSAEGEVGVASKGGRWNVKRESSNPPVISI